MSPFFRGLDTPTLRLLRLCDTNVSICHRNLCYCNIITPSMQSAINTFNRQERQQPGHKTPDSVHNDADAVLILSPSSNFPTMHPVKRRKLDAPSSNLTKPFRSPLRRDHDRQHPPQSNTEDKESQTDTITSATNTTNQGAQKEYTTLTRRLTALRQSVDTAQQALQIETDHQNMQVQALIQKWTSIVRGAAEELYDSVKEDVNHRPQAAHRLQPSFWDDQDNDLLTEGQRKLLQLQQDEIKSEAERHSILRSIEDDSEGGQVSTDLASVLKNPLIRQIAGIDDGNIVETA
jgi:hypothetical protein